jgi:hypothetical protein
MQKSKQLINVYRGVYRLTGAPVTWKQQLVAALLVLPNGVASHTSAARLHGLRVEIDDTVHITMPKSSSHVRSAIALHRSALRDDEITVMQRLTCTTVERTLVDLASILSRAQLRFVLDEAVIAAKTSFVAVEAARRSCGSGGRKGHSQSRCPSAGAAAVGRGFREGDRTEGVARGAASQCASAGNAVQSADQIRPIFHRCRVAGSKGWRRSRRILRTFHIAAPPQCRSTPP